MEKLKLCFTIWFAFIFFENLNAQMSFSDFSQIDIGSTYKNYTNISSIVKQEGKVLKGAFFGAYYVEYEDVEIDYFGKGQLRLYYAKDTLVEVEFEMKFHPYDTATFFNRSRYILKELNQKQYLVKNNNSDLKETIFYTLLRKDCNRSNLLNNLPIESCNYGYNYYNYKFDKSSTKYIVLNVQLLKFETDQLYSDYKNNVIFMAIMLHDTKFDELRNQLLDAKVNYSSDFN